MQVLKCSGIYKRSHNSSIGQTETFMAGPGVHSLATLYQVAWIKHPWVIIQVTSSQPSIDKVKCLTFNYSGPFLQSSLFQEQKQLSNPVQAFILDQSKSDTEMPSKRDAYNDMNASSFSYYALIYDDLMVLEDIRCLALEKV
ncbi:hypothetical protein C5167_016427 [Papaver somniferum]|nr:hypothetical protein C5167_016427 [Papaver somniferum]